MNKKRILFVDLGSDYGGVETYLRRLGTMLGPYCAGYALLSLPKLAVQLRDKGMTVFCFPFLGPRCFKSVRLLVSLLFVPYMLLRYRIGTVQINGFFESLLLGPLRLTGCTTIFTMHIPFETEIYSWFRCPGRFFPRLLSRYSLPFASQVVCVSETIGEVARTVLPREKVRVIANWVETSPRVWCDLPQSKPSQLLFVGRLEQYKGVQVILQAMRQIPEVSLLVVGDGSYRRQLESLAKGLDVRFAGFQDDPLPFYRESSVFINPSLGPEGLPLVSLEAMAHGLPCVFSDLPVHREISMEGTAASLFESGNGDHLAAQLKLMLGSALIRQRYCTAARQQVAHKYSVEAVRSRYIETFGLCKQVTGAKTVDE